jgi:hypothetical protein
MGAPDNRFKTAMVLRQRSSGVSPHNTGRSPAHAASAWSLRHVHPGMACSSTTALFARPRKPEEPPPPAGNTTGVNRLVHVLPVARDLTSRRWCLASPDCGRSAVSNSTSTATDQQISLERSRSFEQALSDMPRPSALQEVSPHHPRGRHPLAFPSSSRFANMCTRLSWSAATAMPSVISTSCCPDRYRAGRTPGSKAHKKTTNFLLHTGVHRQDGRCVLRWSPATPGLFWVALESR